LHPDAIGPAWLRIVFGDGIIMEEFGAMALVWVIHAGIAVAVSAPIVFVGRKRVRWQVWELLVLVLPFIVWSGLMASELSTGKKSLANLSEPFYFALAIPVAALVRIAAGPRVPQPLCSGGLIAAMCLLAGAVFFLVPALPE
jgi:hypothetical protein